MGELVCGYVHAGSLCIFGEASFRVFGVDFNGVVLCYCCCCVFSVLCKYWIHRRDRGLRQMRVYQESSRPAGLALHPLQCPCRVEGLNFKEVQMTDFFF